MTEAEWLACDYPSPMLEHLGSEADARKSRLFATACCRRVWGELRFPALWVAVEAAERFADGGINWMELEAAHDAANTHDGSKFGGVFASIAACSAACFPRANIEATVVRCWDLCPNIPAEWVAQSDLLRCIVGNPFRPVTFAPEWRSPTVVALADAIYADRAFDRLPVLADALEEAGCDSPDVLAHCRDPGPHARGCWVVDGVLGRGWA